jgi:hypothetical protein
MGFAHNLKEGQHASATFHAVIRCPSCVCCSRLLPAADNKGGVHVYDGNGNGVTTVPMYCNEGYSGEAGGGERGGGEGPME